MSDIITRFAAADIIPGAIFIFSKIVYLLFDILHHMLLVICYCSLLFGFCHVDVNKHQRYIVTESTECKASTQTT